jgi:hypothetical protein
MFYFATVDGNKPKCRPLGFQILHEDKIYFGVGDFKEVYKQIKANPNGLYTDKGEPMYSALITVQPNDGFYRWLMANANQVVVTEPYFIRQEAKRRLQEALRAIEDYENKD